MKSNKNLKMQSKSEKLQQEYYDGIAGLYDLHHADKYSLEYRKYVLDKILKDIKISNMTVLDAMCGGGEWTHYLLQKGAKVHGLDISKECCKIYKKRFPKCKVIHASILKSGLKNNSYDLIVTDSLHHILPHINKVIKEIYRLLKPKGYLCFYEIHSNSFPDIIRKKWYKKDNFFQEEEKSIDIKELKEKNKDKFIFEKEIYGGNLAYLLVEQSMAFRIPPKIKKSYSSLLITFEKMISKIIKTKFFSCYVLGLWQKK